MSFIPPKVDDRRPSLEQLIEQARRNEAIARKLFEIEVEVMGLQDTGSFLECLTDRVRTRFDLDEVWLVLTDIDINQKMSASLAEQGALVTSLMISTVDYMRLTKNQQAPLLTTELGHLRRLIPQHLREQLGSVALLPLLMENRVIGALMLGTADPARYRPHMDCFFLHQLAVKASVGLAGVWAREQLRRLATRDPLTGLRNRREMEESLRQEISRAVRYGQPLSLIFIDCDDFKQVNDTWGHDCGDAYLCHVAKHLVDLLRQDDLVCRFAGDEFIMILPNQSAEKAAMIGERSAHFFQSHPLRYGEREIPVTFSYGIASTEEHRHCTMEALLKQADQRLYEMKRVRKAE